MNWKIKSPKFKVKINRQYQTVNEYTLRNLMLLHSQGKVECWVKCRKNEQYPFKYEKLDDNGKSPYRLSGFSIADDLAIALHNFNKQKPSYQEHLNKFAKQ